MFVPITESLPTLPELFESTSEGQHVLVITSSSFHDILRKQRQHEQQKSASSYSQHAGAGNTAMPYVQAPTKPDGHYGAILHRFLAGGCIVMDEVHNVLDGGQYKAKNPFKAIACAWSEGCRELLKRGQPHAGNAWVNYDDAGAPCAMFAEEMEAVEYPVLLGFTATIPGEKRDTWDEKRSELSQMFGGREGENVLVMMPFEKARVRAEGEFVGVDARKDDVSVMMAMGSVVHKAGTGTELGQHVTLPGL